MINEDIATSSIERQTAKIPSVAFLVFALGSMVASAAFLLSGRKQLANFIGQWAPSILILGTYNKIAKELAVPRQELHESMISPPSGVGSDKFART